MKKIVVSTLAVLMACPAFANNTQTSSWQLFGLDPYVALRGGMTYSNLNVKHDGHKKTMSDWVFQGRAALGLEVCDAVRSEIEWSIFSKAKDHANFGDAGRIDVETKMQTLLWNNYWEIGDYQMIRPFVGLGVGVAFTDIKKHATEIDYDRSDDKTRFAAMGTLGMTFDWEKIAVDVAARYNYVDVQSGMHDFGADIGIRFMF